MNNNHFDDQAKEWDNDPSKVARAEAFAKGIADFIKPDQTLNALEFGCGTGLLSFQLKDAFRSITLTDTSQGMIEVLQQKIKTSSMTHFKAAHVDLLTDDIVVPDLHIIYSMMTMHHIVNLDGLFAKFNSMLQPNAYVCIADLVKDDGSFHAKHPDFDGHNGFDRNELKIILRKYGFEEVHYQICFEIVKEVADGRKSYPLFLMIAQKS